LPRAFRRSAYKFPRESFSNKCATNVLAIDQEDSAQAVVGATLPLLLAPWGFGAGAWHFFKFHWAGCNQFFQALPRFPA
jgi:hypothetical protein